MMDEGTVLREMRGEADEADRTMLHEDPIGWRQMLGAIASDVDAQLGHRKDDDDQEWRRRAKFFRQAVQKKIVEVDALLRAQNGDGFRERGGRVTDESNRIKDAVRRHRDEIRVEGLVESDADLRLYKEVLGDEVAVGYGEHEETGI